MCAFVCVCCGGLSVIGFCVEFFGCACVCVFCVGVGVFDFFDGEFDPGSGRTLAVCLTHASRTVRPFFGVHEWRTGE